MAYDAVYTNDVSKLRKLLKTENVGNARCSKAVSTVYTSENCTLLHMAVLRGHIDSTKLLLSARADVNALNINGISPLGYCNIRKDVPEITLMLIKAGANVNSASTSGGYTPLIHATLWGLESSVTILLANGAQPNDVLDNGKTAHDIALSQKKSLLYHDTPKGARFLRIASAIVSSNSKTGLVAIKEKAAHISQRIYMRRLRLWVKLIGRFLLLQRRASDRVYAPGGVGYHESKKHFIDCVKISSNSVNILVDIVVVS